jgi:thiosulfate reductase cytochrome b subunit
VTRGEHAVNDCKACHNDESRVAQPIELSKHAPNGVVPAFDTANNVNASGEIVKDSSGTVYYNPVPANDKMYIFGSSASILARRADVHRCVTGGSGMGAEISSTRKQAGGEKPSGFVYRFIAASLAAPHPSSPVVHRLIIQTRYIRVFVPRRCNCDNVLAVILVLNAFLSIFYHIATDRLKEFIPHPYGFFDDAIVQAKYYINGIFKGEAHPFEKRPDSRMNPIQKATYFGILNVLLPLQILTGIDVVQKWLDRQLVWWAPLLAPFHSSSPDGAFIVVHVYDNNWRHSA